MSKKSKQALLETLEQLRQEKELLLNKKKADSSGFKEQARLEYVTEQIVDIEEQIDSEEQPESLGNMTEEGKYIPKKGTEHLVHLRIIRGKKYDENTGKQLSEPYIQLFTYNEYLNFKNNAPLIGYSIEEVLYNPFKDEK